MIDKLYEASVSGVIVKLLVRGVCCLRPGLKGISENITVISIIGRYLEHSRVYWFHNNGKPKVYIGSADIMGRNLDRRIEAVFPIASPPLKKYIMKDIVGIQLKDTIKARVLQTDGRWLPKKLEGKDQKPISSQKWSMEHPREFQVKLEPASTSIPYSF